MPVTGDVIICPTCARSGVYIHVEGQREGEPYQRWEVSHNNLMHFLDAEPVGARILMHHGQPQPSR